MVRNTTTQRHLDDEEQRRDGDAGRPGEKRREDERGVKEDEVETRGRRWIERMTKRADTLALARSVVGLGRRYERGDSTIVKGQKCDGLSSTTQTGAPLA
ncbi:hypothetical protein Scep_028544 [Stephania cephalantha]|uniref:Uncharacterized protein n=1 Tax=Stephania cephalantha TaxID=152367 RepID=A0AAP0EEQ9_9MAGN